MYIYVYVYYIIYMCNCQRPMSLQDNDRSHIANQTNVKLRQLNYEIQAHPPMLQTIVYFATMRSPFLTKCMQVCKCDRILNN